MVFLCVALAAIILAAYMQVGNHEFLSFDDFTYITNNKHVAGGMTGPNILWAFTSIEAANWHPLTWLSHMTDVRLYGMNPGGHHLTSVAIHTLSAMLLFLLLFRLTGALWQSYFVAAMFALHPMHVESVAWVAERKDVLSTLFWFLTLFIYTEYTAKRKISLYFLTLFTFVLGLMSKPMIVTLPIVMLLADFWPLGRFRHENGQDAQLLNAITPLIKEKIPFFICSLLSGFITLYAQHKGGAVRGLDVLSFQLRSENALIAYVKYIGKTIWPHDLAVLYPFPLSIPLWQVVCSLCILLLISVAVISTGRRHPYLAVGWLWFFVTLVPVIGLLKVGGQSMADRYMYIPATGLFIMAAWGIPELTKGLRCRTGILALLAAAAIFASTVLTWRQLGYWQDNISLYRHTLHVTTGNPSINYNLGLALQRKGDLDAAIHEYREALRVNPEHGNAHHNLGAALASKGDHNAAIHEYREALRLDNNNENAHNNLGAMYVGKGNLDAAILEFREALRINPSYTNAHDNLEAALAQKRMHGE